MFIIYLIVAASLGYLGINAAEMYVQIICIAGMAYCMFNVGGIIQQDIDRRSFSRLLEEKHSEYKIHYKKVVNYYESRQPKENNNTQNINPPDTMH